MKRASPLEVLQRSRERALDYAGKVGAAKMRRVLEKAQRDLERRLREAEGLTGPGGASFTAAQLRATLAQVRDVLRVTALPVMRDDILDVGKMAAEAATQSTVEYVRAADAAYVGLARPLAIDHAMLFDKAVAGTEASILRRIGSNPDDPRQPGVLQRYGMNTVGAFEEVLQQRLLAGASWADTRNELIAESPFLQGKPMYWAERIVRTECLTGDTLVSGAVVRAVFRRWYDGEVVEVVTEGGRKFTTTPNHPMLTRRAWVHAGRLREGDDLVCYAGEQNAGSARDEDVNEGQTPIAEIFDAAAAVGISERKRTAKPDFHGDGVDGEVEVARPFRPLHFGKFAPIFEPTAEQIFAPSDLASARFCCECGCLLSIDEQPCFCRGASCDTHLVQPTSNEAFVYGQRCSDPLDALSRLEAGHDRLLVDVLTSCGSDAALGVEQDPRLGAGSHLHTGLTQQPANARGVHAELGTDRLGARAVDVEFDRVVSVRVRSFSGHVYNLETPHGYFAINRAYTGNTMGAHNRAGSESITMLGEQVDDMVKVNSATFDSRTSADSYAVHGQIRRPSEAFDSWFGSFMHPPDRPNDRSVVVPHRLAWPFPASLKPKSDGEIAARWAAEGRKGSPPARPRLSTVPLDKLRSG